ncbi:MAG: queuosine precursor transporter [Syntrophales bacterium]|nr:queuosine precursor transporter [Syntrophales bacterium]MCK9527498.1 queuosine precursor transporter [Syntrophales bacterium]MDX9922554.1 queuosine precursor transporter [Syntrophales bacterium]
MNIRLLKYFFITALLLSNILATKIINVGGLLLPAAIILYPLTFLVTDVVGEVQGKKSAQSLVMAGFYMSFFMVLALCIARWLPAAPFWDHGEAWDAILGATPRIVMASMIAYLVSQTHDVWAFHWWRDKTEGRHLWLRNTASTVLSQGIDTVLFITIAFGGLYAWADIATMVGSQYLVKVVIAVLDTPLCYLLVRYYGNTGEHIQGS